MEYRLIKNTEYEQLINFLNKTFQCESFEKMLPKVYYPENNQNYHFGAFDSNKLVGVVGVYPMTIVTEFAEVNVAGIGAVCTDSKYEGKGIMSTLMSQAMDFIKDNDFAFTFLLGNRQRYARFGFDWAGKSLLLEFTNKSLRYLKESAYDIYPITKDSVDLPYLLSLYNKSRIHMARSIDDFYDVLCSWNGTPYIVKVDNNCVGYFVFRKDFINEIIYNDNSLEIVLRAILSKYEKVQARVSLDNYDLINYANKFSLVNTALVKVVNYTKTSKLLNIDESIVTKVLLNKEIIDKQTYILGNCLIDGFGLPLYLFQQDLV